MEGVSFQPRDVPVGPVALRLVRPAAAAAAAAASMLGCVWATLAAQPPSAGLSRLRDNQLLHMRAQQHTHHPHPLQGDGSVVAGLEEALLGARPGTKLRALVPPELGYAAAPGAQPQARAHVWACACGTLVVAGAEAALLLPTPQAGQQLATTRCLPHTAPCRADAHLCHAAPAGEPPRRVAAV